MRHEHPIRHIVDAQEMQSLHPKTFQAPAPDVLRMIKENNTVKICLDPGDGGERFWVTVTRVDGDRVHGIVDNDLICTDQHGVAYRDEVEFEKRHIYRIWP